MVSFLVAALGWEPAPPQDLRLLKAPVHGRRETGERGGGCSDQDQPRPRGNAHPLSGRPHR